jgi:hypothetical protein
MRWRNDNLDRLNLDPMLPAATRLRHAKNWRPFFSMADLATRGDFPGMIRKLAVAETAQVREKGEKEDLGSQLMIDMRVVFDIEGGDFVTSKKVQERLNFMEGRPWGDMPRRGDAPDGHH